MDSEMKEMFNIIIGKIDGLESRMDRMETRMDRMEDRQVNTDLSLSALIITVERIDTVQNEMLLEHRHLKEKVDLLSQSQKDILVELKGVKATANRVAIIQENDIAKNIGVINDNIVDINRKLKRLDKVEYTVENHDGRVFALEQAVKS